MIEQRDRYTINAIHLQMVENGGWIATITETSSRPENIVGAFRDKKDLMGWLDENLRYHTYQHETDGAKEGPDEG